MKIQLFKDAKFYRRLYGKGTKLPPTIQTSVNVRNFAELYLHSLKTYHFQFGSFTNFRLALFGGVDGFTLTGRYKN